MIDDLQIWKTLEKVMDPEIDISLVDLGIIYDVSVNKDNHVLVTMTLTKKGCPMSQTMTKSVETAVAQIPGVTSVTVELVWDPPWNPRMMSLDGQKRLGKHPGAKKIWEKH